MKEIEGRLNGSDEVIVRMLLLEREGSEDEKVAR